MSGSKICRILREPTLYNLTLGIVIIVILVLILKQGYISGNKTDTTYGKDNQKANNELIEDICTLVKLPDGKLRGRKAISSRNIEFYAFQQIPYAMPPIGKLRFEDPVPPEKWDGILNVTKNTKTCFQFINFLHVHDWRESQTEDCLYLNVYTPVCASSGGSLAVMFYIYGSGYLSGASDYDLFGPDHLMENGVIVVTFNNRLGPLGFLSTGDNVIPGNYGMKDQVLALKWVNRNIHYFGGDPNRISIVGHSSGAASVGLHLMSKLSRGLYNSAVCQSGTSLSSWSYQLNYKRNAHHLAVLLDSSFNKNASSEELLKFLRTVPAEEIDSVVHNFPKSLLDQMDVQGWPFTPAIEPDHEKAFLTENMYSAIQEGHMDRVPLLIGIVSEEAFTKYDSVTSVLSERVEKWKDAARTLDEDSASMVLDNMNIVDETEKKRIGEAIRNLYPPGPFANDLGKTVKKANNELIEDICTLVKLPDGKLRGRKAISSRNIEFYAFQQIPYAMPPIGKLRFEDPVPPEKWDGILNVTKNTKTCFQFINFLHVYDWRESQTEDCLYLNVYTPVCASSGGSLAVMFYIYGSGYLSGASDYDLFGPDHLMKNGVIVVTFNYRLGPLGFLSTGDNVIPGNYGMKDQVLALKWVNRNILYFGGDPNRISIVGHSSGAASVGLHLMSKLSRGLYNSAVCQSGTSLSSWSYQLNYKRNAHHLAVLLDSSFNKNASSEELLKFLRTVPAEEIDSVVHNFPKSLLDQMDVQGWPFTPAIEPDHEKAFLTENMYSAIQEGHMDRVPLLIGIVSEEAFTKYDS
ncbi:unnamed protein product [Phaedon cochleariae]|uniref:Carboxylesterase type B domain-containing protein n=1 Tax=Phaedon cochleariae TaxID=80249 RepID=A0A9N9SEC9_PHACE|nr:unnamed protein product [Phaedon cochleariae]